MSENITTAIREAVLASGWSKGKEFDVIVKDDEILIYLAGKPRYTLEELLAQCEPAEPLNTNIDR
jgi:antitoxin component of MazEF toxin-antitoxin module